MKKVINYLELSVLQNEYIALDKIENKTRKILDRIDYLDDFFWDSFSLWLQQVEFSLIEARHMCSVDIGNIEDWKWVGDLEAVGSKVSRFDGVSHWSRDFHLATHCW